MAKSIDGGDRKSTATGGCAGTRSLEPKDRTGLSPVTLDYRPDIDGLRAVAVIAVLLFHAFPGSVPGGFSGVDMFFVISGFLISRIIVKELRSGAFRFADFYARRIRRIFPSLVCVLAATLVAGWFILLPDEYRQLAKNTAGAALFISNFLLARGTGYFDPDTKSNPLLHLWSLGIEEQFYIAWPVLLVLLSKRTKRFLPVLSLLLALSFTLNVFLAGRMPTACFYLPITRMWELAMGGVLACVLLDRGEPRSRLARESLSVLGVLLIIICLALVNEQRIYPGWWALLPTLGTALLIGAGSRATINRTLLASPVCVFAGLISYPLYLWHWPMLVYLKLAADSDFAISAARLNLLRAGALAISVGLAWATWRFVERPLRRGRANKPLELWGLAASMSAIALFGTLGFFRLVTARLDTPTALNFIHAAEDRDFPDRNNFKTSTFVLQKISSLSNRTVFFAGDSHVEQYWPRVKAAIRANPALASAVFGTSGACPPLPGLNQSSTGFHCPEFYRYWTGQANASYVGAVVIGANWQWYFTGGGKGPGIVNALGLTNVAGEEAGSADIERAWYGLETTMASFVRSGKRVFILSSTPTSPAFDPRGVFHRFRSLELTRLQPLNRAGFESFIAAVEEKLVGIATRTGATVVRPVEYFCDDRFCPAVDELGSPLYRDASHLRASTAAGRAAFIDRILAP